MNPPVTTSFIFRDLSLLSKIWLKNHETLQRTITVVHSRLELQHTRVLEFGCLFERTD